MQPVQYVFQFRGSAWPKPGAEGYLICHSEAAPVTITTTVSARGVDAEIRSLAGSPVARFDSEVRFNPDGTFIEYGTIDFGAAGALRFSTRGVGSMAPGPDPAQRVGTILWQVDGGTGRFEGASGNITSNFMVGATGEVVDNQWGVIFLR
jgi:hypothetical protein